MVNVQRPVKGCAYATGDYPASIVSSLLSAHTAGSHMIAPPAAPSRRPPKVDRPDLSDGIDEEAWNAFQQSLTIFKRANGVEDEDLAVQLYSCCKQSLKQKITAVYPDFLDRPPNELLPLLKNLTVIPVARTVKQNDFLQMKQEPGDMIRTFHSKVKSKAITCHFKTICRNPHAPVQVGGIAPGHLEVDYSDEMIRHVILNGLYDEEIRRDIFGNTRIDDMGVAELVTLIESKETARDATSSSASTNALSSYRKIQRRQPTQQQQQQQPDVNKKGKCSCGITFNVYAKLRSGNYNKTPFTVCKDCWQQTHQRTQVADQNLLPADHNAITFALTTVNLSNVSSTDSTPSVSPPLESKSSIVGTQETNHPVIHTASVTGSSTTFNAGKLIMKHHVFKDGQWKSRLAQPHPIVKINISTNIDDYNRFKLRKPQKLSKNLQIPAIVDSGAQCCVWSWTQCREAGFLRSDLIPVQQKLNGVSKSHLTVYGAILLRIHGVSTSNTEHFAAAVVYISPDVSDFYMSRDVMVQLCIVPQNFPSIGSAIPLCEVSSEPLDPASCSCPPRCEPTGLPDHLPMQAIEKNIPAMKDYLLDKYKNNVFNQCIHGPIPQMTGPPMRIHVDPEAEGTVVAKPGKCPLHWEDKVLQKYEQDLSMGVIEPYPSGTPPKWIHRAHYVKKPDGDIRRVIDLSPLNKHCKREIHGMMSPFELAKGIPADTWRTVTDAWNGYHSIPLHEEDRHLTAFLGPTGKLFQYCVAPQGYASSGDGYNCRCEALFNRFERLRRCVDDTMLYDPPTSLADHWWRVINFLECCARNGVILNPKKFQFCQKSVDFAGFHLTPSTVEPLPKYIDSITYFPTPTSTTDIKAWFGLVNQVAHYAQLRDILQPFRQFLSPSIKFFWNDELQHAFEASKQAIIQAIKRGVEIFDIKRKTCLRLDWSKQGIGFYLSQKHCSCDSNLPGCCEDGWRITLCGSRFLQKSEE